MLKGLFRRAEEALRTGERTAAAMLKSLFGATGWAEDLCGGAGRADSDRPDYTPAGAGRGQARCQDFLLFPNSCAGRKTRRTVVVHKFVVHKFVNLDKKRGLDTACRHTQGRPWVRMHTINAGCNLATNFILNCVCGGPTARVNYVNLNPGQAPGFVVTGLRPSLIESFH